MGPCARDRDLGGLATLGTTVGPYPGGWLVDHASWRWVFLLNLPLIVAGLIALRRVPESRAAPAASLDAVGAAARRVGIGGVVYALTEGAAAGWDSRVVIARGLGGVASLRWSAVERRAPAPMLRRSLFSLAPVRRDQRDDRAVLRRAGRRAATCSCSSASCGSATRRRPGGRGADPGVGRLPAPLAAERDAGGAVRPALADGRPACCRGRGVCCLSSTPGPDPVRDGDPARRAAAGLGLGLAVTPLTAAVLAAVATPTSARRPPSTTRPRGSAGSIAIALVPALIGGPAAPSFTDALADGYRPR